MDKDEIMEELNRNMEYLEKSNALIDSVRKYYEIINEINEENEVENVEMESEENG